MVYLLLFDTHAHITLSKHLTPEIFLANAREAGVNYVLDPGLRVEDISSRQKMLRGLPGVVMGVAIAPDSCNAYVGSKEKLDEDLHQLETIILKNARLNVSLENIRLGNFKVPRIVAMSEIGLEYFHCKPPYNLQHELFSRQLAIAERNNLPVFLHLRNYAKQGDPHFRDAYKDALEIVKDFPKVKVCVHCFTAGAREAEAMLSMGNFLAFGGVVTFKSAKEVAEVVVDMAEERILLETDAPYLSPHPFRSKLNESSNLPIIAKFIANVRNLRKKGLGGGSENGEDAFDDFANRFYLQCTRNAMNFLKL